MRERSRERLGQRRDRFDALAERVRVEAGREGLGERLWRDDELERAWLDDFAARDVRYVGFGYVTLRRPADGVVTLRRYESVESSGSQESGLGAHLARGLRVGRWLASVDDEQLGLATLIAAPDVTEERHYWPGSDDPAALALVQGGGFGRRTAVETGLAGFVGACDGDLPVAVIVGALAVSALLLIPQAFVTQGWQLIGLRFLMGLALGGLLPSITSVIRHNVPDGVGGNVLGMSISAQYVGQVAGPVLGGFAGGHFGMRAVFLATSALMAAGACYNWLAKSRQESTALAKAP